MIVGEFSDEFRVALNSGLESSWYEKGVSMYQAMSGFAAIPGNVSDHSDRVVVTVCERKCGSRCNVNVDPDQ